MLNDFRSKTLCLIPARKSSQRIKKKNKKIINGKPLIFWTINYAKNFFKPENIYVSSDDKDILNISKKNKINFIKRPKKYCLSKSKSIDVAKHCLDKIKNGTFNKSEDILVGEYKYVEDGQIIMDYLPLLDDPTIIGHKHYVSGNLLMANYYRPPCNNCQPDDRRLMLFWIDPEKRNLRSSSVLRRFQENGVEKLEMRHYLTYGEGSDQDLIPRIPYQTYIMTLQ